MAREMATTSEAGDPVAQLVAELVAARRDVHQLGQGLQGTLKAAQAAEAAASRPRTLTLDASALGPAFGVLSDRITSLDASVSALGADRLRSEVAAALHDARAGIDAAIQEGVRRHATSRWTLRLAVILGLVVLGATGVQFASAAAATAWSEAERVRLAAELERLRVALPTLQAQAEDWQRRAGRAVLRACQSNAGTRLCARIDLSAPRFGTRGEYAVLDGY
jgi:hypothetical protein